MRRFVFHDNCRLFLSKRSLHLPVQFIGKACAIRSELIQCQESRTHGKIRNSATQYYIRTLSTNPPPTESDRRETKKDATIRRKEFSEHWIHQLQSPPNIITSLRIMSTPIVSYFVLNGQYDLALYGCMAFAASDWLDGWVAREFNMKSVLGSYLDPLADKLLINSFALSLWYVDILPTPLVALWTVRDVILVVATYRHVAQSTDKGQYIIDPGTTPLQVKATTLSKGNTALQFLTVFVALLQPIYSLDPVLLESFW
jgi:phosphatidylglycerophosphate synthase